MTLKWRVDKSGATIVAGWEPQGKDKSSQDKWNDFMKEVNSGKHPATAGVRMEYKLLNKATGQAQIKLSSSGTRASFFVDEKKMVINKIQLGGHT